MEKLKREKPAGSGKKKLYGGKGTNIRSLTISDEQFEFLKKLSGKDNASVGARMLCDRAMRSYPDNLPYPEQLIVALEVAIAAIEKKDLAKLDELQPILEQCLEEVNSLSNETILNEMIAEGVIKTEGGGYIV